MTILFRYLCVVMVSCLTIGNVTAQVNDSLRVEQLLQEAASLPPDSNRILHFAKSLLGTPYVAGTLDEGKEEALVVHLDKVDCTTFVETVVALSLTDKKDIRTFDMFCRFLQLLRYRNGIRDGYVSRLHYFSDWICDNERKGFVHERTQALSSSVMLLHLNFMSTHPASYPFLKNNPGEIARIAAQEKQWQGVSVPFLPKIRLREPADRLDIHNGDILAITTHIPGLDVVHVGFAVWQGDVLHLLHASSVARKVILDPLPLFDYTRCRKAHTGVRVVSVLLSSALPVSKK